MKKILVVDDDANFLSSLTAKLALGEYEVDACTTGQDALEHIKEHNPDLVILDLMLPDVHGHQVLENSKEEGGAKNTKFVICTNDDDSTERKQCTELGAADYLVKSKFTLDELVDKIHEHTK